MPRHGTDTFCCGAGGGRIWTAESDGGERPSEQRIREAQSLGALDYFVVSCPKDLTMYTAAALTVGGVEFEVVELTALLERAADSGFFRSNSARRHGCHGSAGELASDVPSHRARPYGRPRATAERRDDMATIAPNSRTTRVPVSTTPYTPEAARTSEGSGWVLFAGIMFMIAASLNVIWGIAAVADSRFFIAGATFMLSGLNTWGWVAIGFGALQALGALSIWRGGTFGRWFGIVIAGLAIPIAMMSIPAYPLWALTLVAIDALIIFGLAVYGGRGS